MNKTYQRKTRNAASDAPAMVVPEQVTVALNEIAADVGEGLLALAVGVGLQVMQAMFTDSVAQLCGVKGKHDPDRIGYRHGTEAGSVTLGGRRVPVRRPRVRAADGSAELALPAYELFSSTEVLGQMAMARLLGGLSTRRYQLGLEPVGDEVTATRRAGRRCRGSSWP